MIRKTITVKTEGEASRLASKLVQKAGKFTSHLWIEEGAKRVNAKSMMGVLSMRLVKGSRFDLICTGDDEAKAAETLEKLFETGE